LFKFREAEIKHSHSPDGQTVLVGFILMVSSQMSYGGKIKLK